MLCVAFYSLQVVQSLAPLTHDATHLIEVAATHSGAVEADNLAALREVAAKQVCVIVFALVLMEVAAPLWGSCSSGPSSPEGGGIKAGV